ncbi:MAG TPA: putative sulfate exporter family transporter [Opitutaceae bacterium]
METARTRHFRSGVTFTALLAVVALVLARLPVLSHLGGLVIALLLGLAWRAFNHVPPEQHVGIGFSAKRLLRLGVVLLGVRLNLDLVLHAGLRILVLDATVITAGLLGITWLGRRLGLDPVLACLIAVDSSICGGSAVAAAAPALRAKEDDIALVIPLCSLIGTAAMLAFTCVQHQWPVTPAHYGMVVGATLHEVAQVMAAVAPFPDAAEIGTVAKLTRVMFLVPAVAVLSWFFARRAVASDTARGDAAQPRTVPKPWFVAGFLAVAAANTLALHFLPAFRAEIADVNRVMLDVANFLMAMAMAGMGLQVDFARLRANGVRAVATAVLGWGVLLALAAGEIWLLEASS